MIPVIFVFVVICLNSTNGFQFYSQSLPGKIIRNGNLNIVMMSSENNRITPSKGFGSPRTPIIPVNSIEDLSKEHKYHKLIETYKTTEGARVFDDMLKFPCEFTVKIIGVNDDVFVEEIISQISSITGRTKEQMNCQLRPSKAVNPNEDAKYISISIRTIFHSSDDLYSVYAIASTDTRVKYIL